MAGACTVQVEEEPELFDGPDLLNPAAVALSFVPCCCWFASLAMDTTGWVGVLVVTDTAGCGVWIETTRVAR